jgi:hypothetical protein
MKSNAGAWKSTLSILVAAALMLFVFGGTAGARRGGRDGPSPETGMRGKIADPEKLERWRNLPSERKENIIKRYRKWEQLPPEKIIKRYRKWEQLPPEKRRKILKRYRKYRNLPPEKQKRLKNRWMMMKKLSPDERVHLKAGVGKFRSFSPGKKQAIKKNMRKRTCESSGSFRPIRGESGSWKWSGIGISPPEKSMPSTGISSR